LEEEVAVKKRVSQDSYLELDRVLSTTRDPRRASLAARTAVRQRNNEDYRRLRDELYRHGIVACKQALPRSWGHQLYRDYRQLFDEARSRPDGTISRGRNRYYFQVHPERLTGLVPLLTNPFLHGLSSAVLGPDYQIVEVAFDVPLPGALHQRWHRDFAMPDATRDEGRINALAFNTSGVDVTPIRGPFEIVEGTQFDDDETFQHQMFPPLSEDYEPRATKRFARLGDISARTPLAIHRGTPNRSTIHRPVLVVGVVAPDAGSDFRPIFSRRYFTDLTQELRRHLQQAELVDQLTPIKQTHDIEGLMMGEPA
jgi:hypothetical protein